MSRRPKDTLRPLTSTEVLDLEGLSRARTAQMEAVIRAKILLTAATDLSYTQAAQHVGRKTSHAVA